MEAARRCSARPAPPRCSGPGTATRGGTLGLYGRDLWALGLPPLPAEPRSWVVHRTLLHRPGWPQPSCGPAQPRTPPCRAVTRRGPAAHIVKHGPGRGAPGNDGFCRLPQVLREGSKHGGVDHRRQLVVPWGERKAEVRWPPPGLWAQLQPAHPHGAGSPGSCAVPGKGSRKSHGYSLPAPSRDGTWSSSSQRRKARGEIPCPLTQHVACPSGPP